MSKLKYDYKFVKDFIDGDNGNGCKLLSKTYINTSTKLKVICQCGEVFEVTFSSFISKNRRRCKKCSKKSYTEKRSNRVYYKCDYCGKESFCKKSKYDNAKRHYCSQECCDKHKRFLLIESNNPNYKGKKLIFTCTICGNEYKKRKYNDSKYNYCSRKCVGIGKSKFHSGENSYNWINNKSAYDRYKDRSLLEYKLFTKNVYERDNYTCKHCGDSTGGNLNAHHLNGYNWFLEGRFDVNNGITLCDLCHKEFHKNYGNGNNTIEQFNEWNNS